MNLLPHLVHMCMNALWTTFNPKSLRAPTGELFIFEIAASYSSNGPPSHIPHDQSQPN